MTPDRRDAALPDAGPRVARVSPDLLDARVVGRETSLFAQDIAAHRTRIADGIAGRRVLVVGGAGSIGSMTTRLLLEYAPAAVHVIDQSENYLAELVRDIRSSSGDARNVDLRLWPIDYGGPIAERVIRTEAPYDVVMNFAALKHVRSEKDVYALLQMLDTNIVRQAHFLELIGARGGTTRYFGVSTDKAANPSSLMGATKRLMEAVLFGSAPRDTTVTSARFANVAFSNGSLLQAWLRRLALGQPLAVPRETRRYFVTLREAGEICLLASTLGDAGEIFIPRLDPLKHLQLLDDVARRVIELHGFVGAPFEDEGEARQAVASHAKSGRWPLLLTPLDTGGEKPYEEFVGDGERAHDVGLAQLRAVRHTGGPLDPAFIPGLRRVINDAGTATSKAALASAIASVIPSFRHADSGKHLDQRM
jgi:FlaA1/EpsC-like NDP-sugar epimerase